MTLGITNQGRASNAWTGAFIGTCVLFATARTVAIAANAGDLSPPSAVSPDATKIAEHLMSRAKALLHAKVQLLCVKGLVDQATLLKLEAFIRGGCLLPPSMVDRRKLRAIFDHGHAPVLAAFDGSIVADGDSSLAAWKLDNSFPRLPVVPPGVTVVRRIGKTATVRSFPDGTAAILVDDKVLELCPPHRTVLVAELRDVDVSLFDWHMMIRRGAAPGQTIEATIGRKIASLTFEGSGPKPKLPFEYVFNPAHEYAPISVIGLQDWQDPKKAPVVLLENLYRSGATPPYPVLASITSKQVRQGYQFQCFLVSSWVLRNSDRPLPELKLPSSLNIFDYRYGSAPLMKTVGHDFLAGKTIEDIMGEPPLGIQTPKPAEANH
jgi:hypothetical protein